MPFLDELDNIGYRYYFQWTITPYNKTVEPNLRNKNEIIKSFIELSNKIGKEKIIWRYDPVIISDELTVEYHIKQFTKYCEQLCQYTETVIISFLDDYKKIGKQEFRKPTTSEMQIIGDNFAKIAFAHGLKIKTCAEEIVFKNGIEKASCIDKELIEQIIGHSINATKDKSQRKECQCTKSRDIGEYNTCGHNCKYCYAR
jgi:hypothetical protein